MYIQYRVIKDPEFKGMKSFDNYTLIESEDLTEHLLEIKKAIDVNRPDNAERVIFYSVPDNRGMRFLSVGEDGDKFYIVSDFRHEWLQPQ